MNIINCAVFCGNRLGGVLSGRGRHLHKAKQYYFRFRICWYRCLQKAKVYELTKFRRHISVNGWDITTSVFEEQTSAILEIYFRFRFRPSAHYSASGYRTLSKSKHLLLKWRHIHFSTWRPRRLNTTSGFISVDVTAFRRSKSISKPNFFDISQMKANIIEWLTMRRRYVELPLFCRRMHS